MGFRCLCCTAASKHGVLNRQQPSQQLSGYPTGPLPRSFCGTAACFHSKDRTVLLRGYDGNGRLSWVNEDSSIRAVRIRCIWKAASP